MIQTKLFSDLYLAKFLDILAKQIVLNNSFVLFNLWDNKR